MGTGFMEGKPGSVEGVVALKDCVRVLNGFGNSLEGMLPKLRDGFIAQDADTARRLASEYPQSFFLSPSGEAFHNATVTGGRVREQGPLALKRELSEVRKSWMRPRPSWRRQRRRRLGWSARCAVDRGAGDEDRRTQRRGAGVGELGCGAAADGAGDGADRAAAAGVDAGRRTQSRGANAEAGTDCAEAAGGAAFEAEREGLEAQLGGVAAADGRTAGTARDAAAGGGGGFGRAGGAGGTAAQRGGELRADQSRGGRTQGPGCAD